MADADILEKIDHLEKTLERIEKRKSLFIYSLHNLNLELNTPLPILIEHDGYQYISYAPDVDVYGCGETEYESIEDLRQSIVDLYFDLKEERLEVDLQKILEYLKLVIKEK